MSIFRCFSKNLATYYHFKVIDFFVKNASLTDTHYFYDISHLILDSFRMLPKISTKFIYNKKSFSGLNFGGVAQKKSPVIYFWSEKKTEPTGIRDFARKFVNDIY